MRHIATLALMFSLTGCGSVPAVLGIAGGSSVAAVASVAATATTVLSDGAKVACALQAAANDLGKQVPGAAATASAISKYAGLACAW